MISRDVAGSSCARAGHLDRAMTELRAWVESMPNTKDARYPMTCAFRAIAECADDVHLTALLAANRSRER